VDKSIHHQQDGYTYIRVEPTDIGREMENLKLTIQFAKAKIEEIKRALAQLPEDTTECEDRTNEMNDLEMLIDDSNLRFEKLLNIPGDE